MKKQTIPDFEDAISKSKSEFFEEFKLMLKLVKESETDKSQVQDRLTELHSKGVNFFNLFSRSLNEYGLENFKHNENIRNSKIDDSINISNTILKYWNLINSLKEKYQIIPPKPSERAYSSIQLFIKTFDKVAAKKLKPRFEELQLPTSGFQSTKTFIDMTKKQQITFGAITGLVLLITLLIITLVIDCPTSFQSTIFTTILALAAAAFATVIPGLINIKYREMVTASGALAVFVIVFFLKPAELTDFKSCQDSGIEGTVYFDNKPVESINIIVPKQNKSTRSDNYGNFKLSLDFSSIDEDLKIQFKNKDLILDTIMTLKKIDLEKSLDIYLKTYCVVCTQKDSSNVIVNEKRYCRANQRAIEGYISSFTKDGINQGRTVECKKE